MLVREYIVLCFIRNIQIFCCFTHLKPTVKISKLTVEISFVFKIYERNVLSSAIISFREEEKQSFSEINDKNKI